MSTGRKSTSNKALCFQDADVDEDADADVDRYVSVHVLVNAYVCVYAHVNMKVYVYVYVMRCPTMQNIEDPCLGTPIYIHCTQYGIAWHSRV